LRAYEGIWSKNLAINMPKRAILASKCNYARGLMSQQGIHTWDIVIEYFQCPRCGYILESRERYEYRLGKYQKSIECERCHHEFVVTKQTQPSFGPLLGEPSPHEMEWNKDK